MVMATTTQTLILSVLFVLFLSLNFQTILVQPQTLTSDQDLAIAKNYLEAYVYLAKNNNDSNNLLEDIKSATRKFQEFYNLKVSGKFDAEMHEGNVKVQMWSA
ncbi:hypothetical protein K1719_021485 [Acacia pycnantha]|nr:hypothetical protein K1719_021485 [Acacia pycnantha]